MPPTIRFTREIVLNAAYQLVRKNGIAALNARAVARELGGSTQPIFRLFESMDELYRELIIFASRQFQEKAEADIQDAPTPYIQLCLTYLLFSRDEPELFKFLFMRDRSSESDSITKTNFDLIFNIIQKQTTLDGETALQFFERTWLFVHGLATCIATKYSPCQDERYLISIVKECYTAAVKMMGLEDQLKLQ